MGASGDTPTLCCLDATLSPCRRSSVAQLRHWKGGWVDIKLMSAAELAAELGARVRAERLRQNWTQQTLADRAGVSRATVLRMEAGDPVQLTALLEVLIALRRSGDLDEVLRPLEPQTIERFLSPTDPTRRRGRR